MEVIHIEDGERIILKCRKHWLVLLSDSLSTVCIGMIPFVLFGVLSFSALRPTIVLATPLIAFASALWLLLVWMSLAIIWTNYFLDMWILTNRRIFNIEQVSLFNRRVATWGLERIQQITVEHEHVLEILFGYGSIKVETAGHTDESVTIHGIPKPERMRTAILEQIGRVGKLEIATKKQAELIHTIGHEAKSYLTKDAAALAQIVEDTAKNASHASKDVAGAALSETRKAVSTLMNILADGSPESGEMLYSKDVFDIATATRQLVNAFRKDAKDRKLKLTFASRGNPRIRGDASKLVNVAVRNVVDNALKYTPSGSIRVTVRSSGNAVLLIVEDTGIGIDAKDRERLFTAGGHGAHSLDTNPESSGYGLSIARRIVEDHGGSITAESEGSGKGSRFIVELPAAA